MLNQEQILMSERPIIYPNLKVRYHANIYFLWHSACDIFTLSKLQRSWWSKWNPEGVPESFLEGQSTAGRWFFSLASNPSCWHDAKLRRRHKSVGGDAWNWQIREKSRSRRKTKRSGMAGKKIWDGEGNQTKRTRYLRTRNSIERKRPPYFTRANCYYARLRRQREIVLS